ncbi:lytic polysaccharide monooxygenase [Saccharopolyspora pogona]|uniref:lytic polysaccharide monooxygenase n=1 Tax=Saccharopolyspora pogona TaxID=333966 RepID=UPI001CC246EC|nr:lytic polysaccharide monooxygenase [Saccharopolyspora pogona]
MSPTITQLQTGDVNLEFKASAKHMGGFQVFITKDGWDPSKPLAWGDLEEVANVDTPPETSEGYSVAAKIPEGKTGQHMLYTIWQRTDSPEAFYYCSDVIFGRQGTAQTGALEAQQPAGSTPAASHDQGTHETTRPATPASATSLWDPVMDWFA